MICLSLSKHFTQWSLWPCLDESDEIKQWILPSSCSVSTIVWLLHLDFTKTLGEKVRYELHKDVAGCFEQILEAAPYKTAAIRPLTSYLTNHATKISTTSWSLLVKQEQTHKWHSPMDSSTWTHQYCPTNKSLHSSALCEHRIESWGFAKRNGR